MCRSTPSVLDRKSTRLNSSHTQISSSLFFFFFNDAATTEIYTLSLHDALPICALTVWGSALYFWARVVYVPLYALGIRSEEHTSELQSHSNLLFPLFFFF